MKAKVTIQEKLKDLRVNHCLTLEHLAVETGIFKTALSSYETDEPKEIPHTVIRKLLFGFVLHWLLFLILLKQPFGLTHYTPESYCPQFRNHDRWRLSTS